MIDDHHDTIIGQCSLAAWFCKRLSSLQLSASDSGFSKRYDCHGLLSEFQVQAKLQICENISPRRGQGRDHCQCLPRRSS